MDTSILLTTNALLSSAAAIVMLVVLRTRKTYPGFAFWTAGIAFLALGAAMLAPGALPPTWAVRLLRNCTLIAGHALILRGVLVFRGVRVGAWLEAAIAASFLAVFGYFNLDAKALDARIVTYCAFAGALNLATVLFTLRRRPAHFGSNDVLLALWLTAFGLLTWFRAAHQLFDLGGGTAFEALKGFGSFYAMAQILSVQLVTLTLVSMNSQRIEWEHRSGETRLRESEERLRSIGDNLPKGFVYRYELVDGTRRFGYVSGGIAGALGLAPADLEADAGRLFAMTTPEAMARFADGETRSARTLDAHYATMPFELPDGRRVWLEFRSLPQRLAEGGVVWNGVALDVTERRRAEEELRRYQAIVESSEDAIVGRTLDGIITNWNRGAEHMFGYTASEAVGRSIGMLVPEELADEERRIVDRIARGESVEHFETSRLHRSGRRITLSVSVSPIVDADGAIVGAAKIARDVTESRRMADELAAHREHLELLVASRTAELEKASERAEAASVAKSDFLANMSHEIRTPLNAMIGMAHLIRRGGLDPEQCERLDKLETAAGHLLEILNAILDLSKIDAGKLSIESIPLRVESVVANVLSMLDDRAQAKRLRLTGEVDPMPADLVGDPTRLQQALLNYANNAIKFTERGGVTIRARLEREDASGALVRFEVEDTGIGIAPDVIPRLFSAFEQADRSTTRQFGGTGLGLAITRRLAESMGGESGVRSVPGVGSVFWFTARLERRAPPADGGTGPGAEHALESLRQRHAGARILLAEDNPVNAEVAQAILEDAGLVVEVAADGLEAVEMATSRQYRLVLMDMQMPRMDGLDATREIRRRLPHPRLPIVAMTANVFVEDRERCREAGMDDFASKPVDPDRLYALLLEWLDRADASPAAG